MRLNIGIVDYGLGNVGSVRNAFLRLGHRVFLSNKEDLLSQMDALVLPGVGAFPAAMLEIKARGLDVALPRLVNGWKKPLLGICLGMQILAEWGEEYQECQGLGFIPGRVRKLAAAPGRKIPHIGWSEVRVEQCGNVLFARQLPHDAFYFDHSYYFETPKEYLAATAKWDGDIIAAVARGHVWGVQFHPEKSQNAGLRLLKAFANSTAMCLQPSERIHV